MVIMEAMALISCILLLNSKYYEEVFRFFVSFQLRAEGSNVHGGIMAALW